MRQRQKQRQRIWGGVLAALMVPLMALGGGAAASATDAPVSPASAETAQEVTSGSFSWGVRYSIRNYLENFGHTEGWVSGYDGATYQKGDTAAVFPVDSGTVDPAAGTASIRLGGSLEMFGFGEDWLYFEDARLDIAEGTATLTVDMIESYNVKERTDDLVLSTWEVGDLEIEDDVLQLTTQQGRFSDTVAVGHLPSYGGPTYAAPNDHTDAFALQLGFGEADGGGEEPATGPYGTSTGTAYPDTSARISVAPGYALNADGSTEITLRGTGFDPGSEGAPANLYVGIGTMKDFSNPEKWRRSQGGSSGPVGAADYTYGNPLMIASAYSSDADVANGVLQEDGTWSATMTVPGKDIASYFGDTIDCVQLQCGIFSFGAHGLVNAKNEAFAAVYFDGQDESQWPDRGGDGGGNGGGGNEEPPTPVPPVDPGNPGEGGGGEETPAKTCEPGGENSTTNAFGATLTVSPAKCLGDTDQTVKISGTGYPTKVGDSNFGGVYVLFGWVDQKLDGEWGPARGGSSGITYTYAKDGVPAGTYQTMVNYPGNTTEPDVPFMSADGDWETELPIKESRFVSVAGTTVDCYEVTCGIITLGAHGKVNGDAEAFTPVYFTGTPEETGTGKPETPGGGGPIANPNVANPAAPAAAGAAGAGLATTGSAPRAALLAAVLVLSAGIFAFSLARLRRPQAVAETR